jgi:NAD(P)-dependent dehydrogenase (short-subunit alcohol dehydrogenase family)
MTHDLRGKTALVTGVSRGLGAAIARKLAACGAKVAINYFGSPQKARHLLDQVRHAGGTAEVLQEELEALQQFRDLGLLLLDKGFEFGYTLFQRRVPRRQLSTSLTRRLVHADKV